ncbi:isoprenylcysteine carboxylmethyltransferase family protein [Pseudoalteromonas sp. CO348]|uniref:methyltransferase family protein n=1 Tax=unclassified Pseudoalteromonas TaxID=194690 RepID=UPI00102310FE|nr:MULTISPECIES: isoprenylcysteine carboxylmethyltransferase family protein [unclassified Pseudoalteromonas]MCG7540197.1 isoprenylcysteine carboxylmethyltransferase family protein [Pseudoalteromonas sp. OF7H-1]RZF98696.1 isoprenylcysteine carboxylmethyltransferase family protein [Pseudoalteromonas sp. CO348]
MKKLLPPILLFLFVILMPVVCWLTAAPHFIYYPFNLLGLVPIALGFALAKSGSKLFAKEETNIMTFNKPDKLVEAGVFQYTRNPMYLGFVIALLGYAVLIGGAFVSFLFVIAFLLIADRWYIQFEEKMMEQTFGDAYLRYQRRVRRWL